MTDRGYVIYAQIIRKSGEIPVMINTNSWMAKNIGSDVVEVEEIPLLPPPGAGLSGEFFASAGYRDEIYTRPVIRINFQTTTAPAVLLVFKVYDKSL